jgi:hypothetical protein
MLKRGKFSRSSGQWQDEDYDVLADGKIVGRILEEGSRFGPPELRWGWSITAIVRATPGVTNGTAATLDEAKAKFRANWTKAKAGDRRAGWRCAHRRHTVRGGGAIRVAKDGEVMSTSILDDPEHWRQRAEESRLIDEQLDDPVARAAMLRIDADYERIAEQARVRALGARPTA